MGKKKKQEFEDDGRTIANMNVEGMPWYNPAAKSGMQPRNGASDKGQPAGDKVKLSRKETAAMMKGVMAAAMLVGFIFIGVFALFILFCVFVWFA